MNPQPAPSAPPWPRLRLDFYPSAVLMSRWEDDGRLTTYPVSAPDVISACTNLELSSGLLAPKTLFWKQRGSQVVLGIYVPPRRWPVETEDRRYQLPLPPLVFAGDGTAYRIFAVKKRPSGEGDRLYHAPCSNVYNNGGICQGNTPFPLCSGRTIQAALTLFLEGSYFNAELSRGKCHRYPEDVRRLWDELDGKKRFPLSELVAMQMTMGSLL